MVTSCTSGQPKVTHSTSRVLRADLVEPPEWSQSYSNVPEQIRVDPGKLINGPHSYNKYNKSCLTNLPIAVPYKLYQKLNVLLVLRVVTTEGLNRTVLFDAPKLLST